MQLRTHVVIFALCLTTQTSCLRLAPSDGLNKYFSTLHNPLKSLDGEAYLSSYQNWATKYPEACGVEVFDDDQLCPSDRLNKQYKMADLAHWNASDILTNLGGKTVTFIGDSMVRQLFTRSVCMLADHIVDLNLNRKAKDELHRVTFKYAGQYTTFLNQWWGSPPNFIPTVHKFADIAVLSTGAFQHKSDELLMAVKQWHKLLAAQKLVYMEYPAPHFPSLSGDYEDSVYYKAEPGDKFQKQFEPGDMFQQQFKPQKVKDSDYICQPMDTSAFEASAAAFRVATANDYFREQNMTIVYNFDETVPIYEQHKGGVDCRHYCNPSPVLDMRVHKLHRALNKMS